MELRSSRSRSRTPFLTPPTTIHDDTQQTTRITRSTTYKMESSSSTKEESYGRAKRTRGKVIRMKSSDYSSDDGDHEVTSSHNEQNSRNEYLEHSGRSNGSSGGAAYRVYKESGEYWNRYPKTDYTYSPHSKDRIELAPGVVNMPNMSRKSIHDSPTLMDCTNKETNTDFVDSYRTEGTYNRNIRRTNLFNNNNNRETVTTKYTERRRYVKTESFWYRVVNYFWSFMVVAVERCNENVAGMVTWLHWMASKCMCFDVFLLRGNRSKKINAILAICLVPLLLLGGFLLSQAIMGIATSLSPITPMDTTNTPIATLAESSVPIEIKTGEATLGRPNLVPVDISSTPIEKSPSIQAHAGFTNAQLLQIAQNLKTALNLDVDPPTIVKIILEDPKLNRVDKVGNVMSEEQLGVVLSQVKKTYNVDRVVEKVLESPSIQNLFETNKREDMGMVISDLQSEIQKLRVGLNDVKTCCGGVRDEGFVIDVLKKFLFDEFKGDVMGWFKQDLDGKVLGIKEEIRDEFKGLLDGKEKILMDLVAQKMSRLEGTVTLEGINEEYVKGLVKGVLDVYDADKTGLVDYALESSGGQILSIRCTEQFQGRTAVFSIFGIPIWHPTHSPRVVISPGVSPGNCWCFQNFPGYLAIQLSANITVEAVSYEHVNKKLISDGKITSAPKDFSVYGLASENERDPALIGNYIFNSEGDSLQFFPAQRPNSVYNMVEFRINSNHGNPQYTCLYRFRVHGKIFNKPT